MVHIKNKPLLSLSNWLVYFLNHEMTNNDKIWHGLSLRITYLWTLKAGSEYIMVPTTKFDLSSLTSPLTHVIILVLLGCFDFNNWLWKKEKKNLNLIIYYFNEIGV